MLQHDPESSQNGPDAAHTRVKVDVLARAIAAIEERRQEQARQREGTALIGDVVRDLQIDATPEELLAEVEAQQKAALFSGNSPAQKDAYADARTQGRTEQQNKTFWMTARISIAWVAAIIFVIWFVSSLASYNPNPHVYMPPVPTYTPRYTPPIASHPFFPTSPPLGMLPAEDEFRRGGPVHALADIADGHPFGCSTYTLESLLRREPLTGIYLYDAERDRTYDVRKPGSMMGMRGPNGPFLGPYLDSAWTLIKYNGQVYLRGWVREDAAQQAVSDKAVSVFNTQVPIVDAGRLVPVTLPLAAIKSAGLYQQIMNFNFDVPSQDGIQPRLARPFAQELLVQGLHPNSHTWEKWDD